MDLPHYPFNTLGDSAYRFTDEDLMNYRTQKLTFDRPFIDHAPTVPGYDYLWASVKPYAHSAGMNRAYAAVGGKQRAGTISHYKDHQLIHTVPPVQPAYGLGHIGISRPEGVSESSMVRNGVITRHTGDTAYEMPTPFGANPEFPNLGLMRPYDPKYIVFPGMRGGIHARSIQRYHKTPFSIKFGEYMHGDISLLKK